MEPPQRSAASLFDVYLRLRPSATANTERFLDVEQSEDGNPKHITIKPPSNDHRKRAIERFAFTRVFEEDASQLDLFNGAGVLPLIQGVLGHQGREGRDGLLATLGVTGSGKSHTILGTKARRGMTQMALDVLFRSTGNMLVHPSCIGSSFSSIAASDVSEAQIFTASAFLDSLYGDGTSERGMGSRAQTPMPVGSPQLMSISTPPHPTSVGLYPSLNNNLYLNSHAGESSPVLAFNPQQSFIARLPQAVACLARSPTKSRSSYIKDGTSFLSIPSSKQRIPRPSGLPQYPTADASLVAADSSAEYAIVISMYEVYNDRIFDLLSGSATFSKPGNQQQKRRALLFKSTEHSPDRKVVAGLKKVVCGSLYEALMVLETGLTERRVAGTGSNAVSSRSHGFFCVEVKKRRRAPGGVWSTSNLTIVDLAGSERARNAKTAGATLAEAGKINESLMYLGQCMQMQSDNQDGSKNIVPFRQCKLTELLFSNSFPSHGNHHHHRNPQKAIMIVTADPVGDFNATSQILRYSALAREVTVPRIPSVTSQILAGAYDRPPSVGERAGSHQMLEELASATEEIARLNEEVEVLSLRLAEETSRRQAAETCWQATEERIMTLEQEIRDECYEEMETRIEVERRRWKSAWDEEADRNDEHLDQKIEILARGIDIHEDPEPPAEERVSDLEAQNEALRRKIDSLEREVLGRSPTKKQRVLKTKKWEVDIGIETP